ncbi:hypothetical protein EMCRGX_G005682 [Ephydatia muelleri]
MEDSAASSSAWSNGRFCSSKLYFEKLDESTSVACNASSRSRLQHTASSKVNIMVKMPNVIWRPDVLPGL